MYLMIRSAGVPLLATLALLLAACSSGAKPQALPPQTMAPIPPETEEPLSNSAEYPLEPVATDVDVPPTATTTSQPRQPTFEIVEEPATTAAGVEPATNEAEDPLTVVLDPGTAEGSQQPRSLFEASQAEKDRRQAVGDSEIVLSNQTLKDYSKGQLAFADGEEDNEGAEIDSESAASNEAAETAEAELGEEYWRNRVLEIRLEWRDSLDRIDELESDIARLRRDFYAEDDPFYRDSQIKPSWDQAIVELEETRRDAEISQRALDEAMEEGRRAGALPGWLREGIELEPTEEEIEADQPTSDSSVHEPSEPVIVDDDGGDGGR